MKASSGLAPSFAVAAAGSRMSRSNWETYLAGAVMLEWLAEGILIRGEKDKLAIADTFAPSSEGVRQLAETIRGARRPKTFKAWIGHLHSRNKLRRTVVTDPLTPLLEEGALRYEETRLLGFIPLGRYLPDPAAQDRIVQRLRAEMLEPGPVDETTAVLAMLLESAGILKRYFSEYERNEWRNKLKRLQQDNPDAWKRVEDIRRAIREIEAAAASGAVSAAAATM